MHPASESHIPDGLLASITLLSEKPRHGVASKNPAPYPGINEANSTAAIGLRFRCWEIVSGTVDAPNNGRNCSAGPASAGQYAISSAVVAGMTAEFFSGIGAQDRTFGPDSSVSAVMAQSAGVQSVLNNYYMTGQTSGLYTFGGVGYAQAGANPVAQFVGSFRYTISPGAGGINLSLTNTTSFRSLTYDIGPQWGRHTQYPGAGVPMGNTHQTYNIFATCKAG